MPYGSPPRPLMQQSTEHQIATALELSKQTAAEEQQSKEMLQRAIALSRDEAQPAAVVPPSIDRQTSEQQLQRALQLSRELAREHCNVTAVQANVDQLRTAMALSLSMTSWAPPPFWAKGVGTAFEELVAGGWHPVTHPDIIDMLGRLTACNPIREVEYTVDGKACKTTMRDDGLLSQVEMATGAIRLLRLVPFFFQVEVSKGHWKAITAPEAITALTTVLASSMPHSYRCATDAGEQRYTTSLANEQGLMLQRNDQTGTTRSVRASPVGPDGRPHFEYLESVLKLLFRSLAINAGSSSRARLVTRQGDGPLQHLLGLLLLGGGLLAQLHGNYNLLLRALLHQGARRRPSEHMCRLRRGGFHRRACGAAHDAKSAGRESRRRLHAGSLFL